MSLESRIDEFILYIGAERGLSSNTQQSYRRDLMELVVHIRSLNVPEWPITIDMIQGFLQQQSMKKKPSSVVRALAAVKVFVRYLFREGVLSHDLGQALESPKLWKTLPTVLSGSDIDRLLEVPDCSTDEGILDRAILELLYGTGLRVSELCSLSLYDVRDDSIKIRGKGGKERIVPIGKQALLAVDKYLLDVRSRYESEKVISLFVNNKGHSLTREYVWTRVKELSIRAGVQKNVSPHTLRHTYATHLLDAGADLRVIQDLLGHSHISSTDKYTHVSRSQIREVFRAFHPKWKEK